MTQTPDELLAEIRRLGEQIQAAPASSAHHRRLVERRDALRSEAARRADALRHPESVRTEIAAIEDRLRAINDELIDAGYNEKHLGRTIQDPGAYRHAINRRIAEEHASEVEELTVRLEQLRTIPVDGSS